MDDLTLPAAITAFINTTNASDSAGFVALFTPDAVLNDWGTEYHGTDGIASWNQTDNIGKQSHFELADFRQTDPQTWIVDIVVTGNGFNGTSPFQFTVSQDHLQEVKILPD
ncbi:nuclear transport factor 2 family protein [Levilactobacillus lindianensis]|uniref:nuclear transport factor 2 family protein n=1 Tax=Levilactobacillus lindianensis TaxID=2486018 RepID=UPI000F742AA8|nr:nuclear transport factor 2 family protein [Levilactobacillus lindianensis]